MSNKPNAAKPSAGPRPSGKKGAATPQGDGIDGKGGSKRGKDSANTRDAHREGNRPAEWSRKSKKNHVDEKARREQGGS